MTCLSSRPVRDNIYELDQTVSQKALGAYLLCLRFSAAKVLEQTKHLFLDSQGILQASALIRNDARLIAVEHGLLRTLSMVA